MRRSLTATIATLCLLAVWLSAPLLAVAHVVVAEHRFCAEHERLEEGTAGHAAGSDEAVAPGQESASASTNRTGEPSTEHEGCAFGDSFTLEDDFIVPSELVVDTAWASVALSVPQTTSTSAALPLLLVAPKTSPPLVA